MIIFSQFMTRLGLIATIQGLFCWCHKHPRSPKRPARKEGSLLLIVGVYMVITSAFNIRAQNPPLPPESSILVGKILRISDSTLSIQVSATSPAIDIPISTAHHTKLSAHPSISGKIVVITGTHTEDGFIPSRYSIALGDEVPQIEKKPVPNRNRFSFGINPVISYVSATGIFIFVTVHYKRKFHSPISRIMLLACAIFLGIHFVTYATLRPVPQIETFPIDNPENEYRVDTVITTPERKITVSRNGGALTRTVLQRYIDLRPILPGDKVLIENIIADIPVIYLLIE